MFSFALETPVRICAVLHKKRTLSTAVDNLYTDTARQRDGNAVTVPEFGLAL